MLTLAANWCIRPDYSSRSELAPAPLPPGRNRYADAEAVVLRLSERLGTKHAIRVSGDGRWRLLRRDHPVAVPLTPSMTRQLPAELLHDSVVVCDGVLERLPDPGPVLETLRLWSYHVPAIVLTTAERDRLRGWGDLGPPQDPGSAREWSLYEFGQLLAAAGLHSEFLGLTATDPDDTHRTSTLAVCTPSPATAGPVPDAFRVLAVVPMHNAADIVVPSVAALLDAGIEVHVVDCGSTDGSLQDLGGLKTRGALTWEQGAPSLRSGGWAALLDRIDQIAAGSGADWCIYHPVDERHVGPWPGTGLRESLFRVHRFGFDAVAHTTLVFRLVDHGFRDGDDVERHFRWFSFADPRSAGRRTTAWRNYGRRVGLADTGGRAAVFPTRRVFAFNFLLKQYPVRSVAQGERRLRERRLGQNPRESARGWPPEPDHRGPDHGLVWPRELLIEFDGSFWPRYLTERLWGVGPGLPSR